MMHIDWTLALMCYVAFMVVVCMTNQCGIMDEEEG